MIPSKFVEEYSAFAKQNELNTGVPYLVTLAQAALESGWGKNAPRNNFFGIKAGKSWKGSTQLLWTKEYENGQWRAVKASFRAYDSPLESFRDHANLLKKRFPKAFNYKDPVEFITSVQTEHPYKYATDKDYVNKVNKIIMMLKCLEVSQGLVK